MSESLKSKTLKGAVWTGLERVGTQGVAFLVSLVLSRLLTPEDYGIIGLLAVFLSVSQMFVDCGFSSSLIRKKDRTEDDFSTVFWFNLAIATACYVLLFATAGYIAEYYKMPILVPVLRAQGVVLVLNAFYAVQVTRLTALVEFKTQAKVSFTGCILSGVVGIACAYCGMGVWALVAQNIVRSAYMCVAFWFLTRWRPMLRFSRKSFVELFGFGSRITAANILHTIYTNVSPLIIGRKYTASDLGFYTRGDQFAAFPGGVFQGTLGKVIYPVLASIQDDEQRLRSAYAKYLRIITALVAPSMLLLAALGEPLIGLVIGEKWLPCVPYLQLLALAWMIDPIISVNLNMLYVKGRSDVVLRLEIVKKIIAIAIVLVAVQFGVIWLCVGRVIYSYIALVLNIRYCGPFIGMGFWRQIGDVLPVYVAAIFSAGVAYGVTLTELPAFAKLMAGGLAGLGVYIVMAKVLGLDLFKEVQALLKRRLSK